MRNSDSFGRPAGFTEVVAASIVIKKTDFAPALPAWFLLSRVDQMDAAEDFGNFA